jgi:hypothetical protein
MDYELNEAHDALTIDWRLITFLALAISDSLALATGEDRSVRATPSLGVVEQQRRQGSPQMPLDMTGKLALPSYNSAVCALANQESRASLRRVAERRPGQSQRAPHRGAGCRQNSVAQCLWLVRARAARCVPVSLPTARRLCAVGRT